MLTQRFIFSSGLALLLSFAANAQDPAEPVLRLTKKEVVLDVVVRDHKGKAVSDLRADEVHVFEDDVEQKLTGFRFVGGEEQLAAESSAAKLEAAQSNPAHAANSTREINFVSIILAPMAAGNQAFARQAVMQFFKAGELPNTLVTIYRLDTRLRLIQPYTKDWAALEKAIEAATSLQPGVAESFAQTALSTQNATNALNAANASNTPSSGNPALSQPSLTVNDPVFQRYGGTLDASSAAGAASQAETELESRLRFIEPLASGMTITDGLAEFIREQARIEGRKVALLLGDGLTLPPNRSDVFIKLISDANRSGVTFYSVDTRGLTIADPESASISAMNQITTDRALMKAQQAGALQGNASAAFDAASSTEDLQRMAVSNTQLALQELAVKTGGAATANTNDIVRPMRRVMEDIRTHYELVYSPASELYDGHFRKISVRIARPKVNLETRSGYYALPDFNGVPLESFELRGLKAVNLKPAPAAFPFRAELLEYRRNGAGSECQMAFDVPLSSLSFEREGKTELARLHASVFAVVQDQSGQIVSKASREFFREIKLTDVASLQAERIEYFEPVSLPAGHYTVSAVVTDENLNKQSVQRRSKYVAPLAAGHLALSSVELVKRVSEASGPRDPRDPFEMQQQRVTPSLGEDASAGQPVPLYFVVYPAEGVAAEPKLTIQVAKDGKPLDCSVASLPKPDETGAIPMVAQLKLAPGAYVLEITVQQGTQAAQVLRTLTVQ